MSKPIVSIPREAYTALQAKVSELTDTNALLDKHVEYLINVVTRDSNEILRLKLDLSYAKAQMDTLYETPASGIKFDGVAAVQAAAPAAAEKKPEKSNWILLLLVLRRSHWVLLILLLLLVMVFSKQSEV